ncbi:MAG: polyphosphate polymerase domain-containing protein [Olsenella sp.]|nr:polyphosphate polymerase domain-containing protein [Olsenella sp.]
MPQLVFKREEIKYRLTSGQRHRLEAVMARHMVPDEHGATTVRNVYYDTPSHVLIRRSMEHPRYKEKIRLRSYADASVNTPVFVELKKKVDGVVYKRRTVLPLGDADALLAGIREPHGQIERELAYSAQRYEGLRPAMYIAYDREAFYARDDHEFRVTLDTRIRCRWDDVTLAGDTDGRLLIGERDSLMEIKGIGAMPLWMADFLAEEHLYKASFSKYGAAWSLQFSTLGRPALGRQRERRPAASTVWEALGGLRLAPHARVAPLAS